MCAAHVDMTDVDHVTGRRKCLGYTSKHRAAFFILCCLAGGFPIADLSPL